MTAALALAASALPAGAAPQDLGGGGLGEGGYVAEIRRTADGVPHVQAPDWGGLGFGQGYATAEDRFCTTLESVLTVRGELSRWFGPGDADANVSSDLGYQHLGLHADAGRRWAGQPPRVEEMVRGYVAGTNAYLRDAGPEGVAGWCAGEPWVQPITVTDLYAVTGDAVLFASSGALLPEIAAAQPPAPGAPPAAPVAAVSPGASNGWALGSDRAAGGGGLLLANPHFPWEGPNRFTEVHLTIPGQVDVYGASLGLPGVQIGFNRDVAWTHTVSSGHRFTAYALPLVPGDPTRYRYGGGVRAMTPHQVRVEVRRPDGSLAPVERTMWSSHYGPMLAVEPGWTDQVAFTLRDANAENTGALEQWLDMDTARSMDDLQRVHRDVTGIPWVNTIATSRDGRAWYADTSSTPNLSAGALDRYRESVAAGGLAGAFAEQRVILLDGSDPGNDWVDAPGAPAPGLVPYPDVPQLERRDYVFNANDSYWLANPRQLLTGYSPLHGDEELLFLPRTRSNLAELERPGTGPDGRWRLEDVTGALFANRSALPGLLRDPVLAACRAARGPVPDPDGTPVDLAPACDALAGWDGDYDTDARGALLWREFLAAFGLTDTVARGALSADAFDPADPTNTPRMPVPDAERGPWRTALAAALTRLAAQEIAPDAPLGQWQYDARTGRAAERVGLPGGTNLDGVVNIADCCSGYVSPSGGPAVGEDPGPGYPVTRGASFVLAVQYEGDGPPRAQALLTYGNPDDPADPDFTPGSRRFADERPRDVAFTESDVLRDTLERTEVRG